MKIFLAGAASYRDIVEPDPPKYILESFFYIKDWQIPMIKKADDFLLDSGAFTFMQSSKKTVAWEEYIERYANFINRNNVKKFFELDIDSVVGYNKVLEYRKRLEKLTNKQCIPVWHKNRGIVEFKKMCDEYNYIAIGGFAAKEILKKEYKNIPPLIEYAHKKKCKIHGLGFTSTSFYDTIRFDSADSTTWTIGGRMGNACYFNGQGMRQYYPSLNGKKPININKLTRHNYSEWIKFQKYAETNL